MLELRPGTHRLKFIVDGEWKCSNELETALDIHGNLVNYIEVKQEGDVMEILSDVTRRNTISSSNNDSVVGGTGGGGSAAAAAAAAALREGKTLV